MLSGVGFRHAPTLAGTRPSYAGSVPSLKALARAHTDLSAEDVEWLSLLLADWQIIADLSFADLVLWLPAADGSGYWAGAQMRPTTGPTAFVDDIVGTFLSAGRRPLVDVAMREGRIAREGDPEWRDDVPVRVEAIPVRRGGRNIAVVARNTNLLGVRTPSRLELSYLQTASELSQMIAAGAFPFPGQRSDHADTPRVGDGFIRVDDVGPGHLRQPQRALGLPQARASPATSPAPRWPRSPASWCPRRCARTRRRSAPCSAPGSRATPSSTVRAPR